MPRLSSTSDSSDNGNETGKKNHTGFRIRKAPSVASDESGDRPGSSSRIASPTKSQNLDVSSHRREVSTSRETVSHNERDKRILEKARYYEQLKRKAEIDRQLVDEEIRRRSKRIHPWDELFNRQDKEMKKRSKSKKSRRNRDKEHNKRDTYLDRIKKATGNTPLEDEKSWEDYGRSQVRNLSRPQFCQNDEIFVSTVEIVEQPAVGGVEQPVAEKVDKPVAVNVDNRPEEVIENHEVIYLRFLLFLNFICRMLSWLLLGVLHSSK